MCANYRGKNVEDQMREDMDARKQQLSEMREERRKMNTAKKRQELIEQSQEQNIPDYVEVNPQQQLARRTYEDPNKQRKSNQRYELGRGKTQEELLDYYARGGLNTKEREFYGDQEAIFANDNQAGRWKVKPLDADTLTKLKANENNAWTNVFDKA